MKKILIFTLIACLLFSGCTQTASKKDDGEVTVKWLLMSLPKNVDTEPAFTRAAEIVKEKLGYNFDISTIDSSDYASKIQVMSAANENFDVMFTSNWINDYYQNVAKGALMPLDDYLKETPDLYNSIPEYWWDAIRVNGKIYGVPNQQIATRSTCFLIPKKNAEILGLDMTGSDEVMTDYKAVLDKLEDYFVKVKEATGEYTKVDGIWNEGLNLFGFEQVIGAKLPGVLELGAKNTKLINQYETEEFKYYIEKRRDWVKKGLIQPQVEDGRNLGESEQDSSLVHPILKMNATYRPGLEAELSKKMEMVTFIKTSPVLTNSGTASTLTGISSSSKNPLEALKVIELVNTDKELYNTLSFGKEGIQWKKTGENRMEKIGTDGWVGQNWAVGSVFNSYLLPGQDDNTWEETKKINDTSEKSVILGFNPSLDKIKPQIAACQSVIDEFFKVLDYGVVDTYATYESFITKLDAAGVDKIFKEIQGQLDSFLASK